MAVSCLLSCCLLGVGRRIFRTNGCKRFCWWYSGTSTAGVGALVIAMFIGKRSSFSKNNLTPPHNPVLTMVGASMLWVGWFGFISGSHWQQTLLLQKQYL